MIYGLGVEQHEGLDTRGLTATRYGGSKYEALVKLLAHAATPLI